jgi:hypothetical protein
MSRAWDVDDLVPHTTREQLQRGSGQHHNSFRICTYALPSMILTRRPILHPTMIPVAVRGSSPEAVDLQTVRHYYIVEPAR